MSLTFRRGDLVSFKGGLATTKYTVSNVFYVKGSLKVTIIPEGATRELGTFNHTALEKYVPNKKEETYTVYTCSEFNTDEPVQKCFDVTKKELHELIGRYVFKLGAPEFFDEKEFMTEMSFFKQLKTNNVVSLSLIYWSKAHSDHVDIAPTLVAPPPPMPTIQEKVVELHPKIKALLNVDAIKQTYKHYGR